MRRDGLTIKAVGFDLFGTLVNATADRDTCIHGIHECLRENGIDTTYEGFIETYGAVRQQQRRTSQVEHREITNDETICEAARLMGHSLQPSSRIVREAVQAYFRPWKLELTHNALQTLQTLRPMVKLGLVSNFTDVPFIEGTLETLGIHDLFDSITISAGCGWRKPSPRIFNILLGSLNVEPEDCIFVGDEIESDIKGAEQVGISTILVRQGSVMPDEPIGADFVISSLEEVVHIVRSMT